MGDVVREAALQRYLSQQSWCWILRKSNNNCRVLYSKQIRKNQENSQRLLQGKEAKQNKTKQNPQVIQNIILFSPWLFFMALFSEWKLWNVQWYLSAHHFIKLFSFSLSEMQSLCLQMMTGTWWRMGQKFRGPGSLFLLDTQQIRCLRCQ